MKKGTSRKKILFLARLYHPHIGGVEKHLSIISKYLYKKGHQVTIICEKHDKSLKNIETIDGIRVIRIPISHSERNKKFEIWKWILKNRELIDSFDVIHIHDVFFWILPLVFTVRRGHIYMTFHGYEGYPVRFGSKIQKKIADMYSSGTITIGDFINKWYGLKSDAVIYGGVFNIKTGSNRPKNPLSAIFFGRFEPLTGIDQYYKAYKILKNRHKTFEFEAIGKGRYRDKLEDISITPFKSKITDQIQNSRFIFVSGYLSMLEAMIQKRLVIAVYNNPLKKDYLLDSPFRKYVDICSSGNDIAEKIEFYIKNPKEEEKKIDKAYLWAKEQTWEKVVDTYINLWQI